ncbi:hypothetical protein GT348_07285 [Aristophania vespae]|uniref:Uncharacterized protein n=1 Tax=Aristophania vespae TaxID=2697033 RepID=A0A6P1NBL7_9PROT|nr:hypothetical protein [Aristophania vespae]QHI96065.1 hypothetical protein GT348_07285 [Aristophania vespae]
MKQLFATYRSIKPHAAVRTTVFSYGCDLSAVADHTPQHGQVTNPQGRVWQSMTRHSMARPGIIGTEKHGPVSLEQSKTQNNTAQRCAT